MAWIGNAVGSAIGLVAILIGALYNARLTRDRDKQIMQDESQSIAMAIGSEMEIYVETLCGRLTWTLEGPEDRTPASMRMLLAPKPVIWPSLADQVGRLEPEVCRHTVRAWTLLQFHAQLLEASVQEMIDGQWKTENARNRCDILKGDLPYLADAVQKLTHVRPAFDFLIP